MEIDDSTKKLPDAATKPKKHMQTNESPTVQFLPEKNAISY